MRVPLKKILFPTDLSDLSNHALPYGLFMAKELGAKLYLCHVVDITPIAAYGEGILDPLEQQDLIVRSAQGQLERLVGQEAISWEPVIRVGRTADEIARVAFEKGVDLAITATHGRSGLKRLILGSVAERLMHILPCPLLVIPSREQESPDLPMRPVRFKRILVGYDFSPDSRLAFEHALSLAQEFEAELHLAHVIEPPHYKDLFKPPMEREDELAKDIRPILNERLKGMVPMEARHWCSPKTTLLAGPTP